jgi:hypothetical protein
MTRQSLLFEFVTTFFFWAGVLAVLLGIAVIAAPQAMFRLSTVLNRWVSTDEAFRKLDQSRTVEPVIYRHHRLFGAALMLGAAYIFYTFAFAFDASQLSGEALFFGSRGVADALLDALPILNVCFSVIGFAIGLVMLARPSLLKGLEQRANRWYRTDDSLKRLDTRMEAPERWFHRRPRLLGLIILVAGLYVVASLSLFR